MHVRPLPVAAPGGTFTRAQATAAGYSTADIRHRIRTGQWLVVRPGANLDALAHELGLKAPA